MVLSFAEERGEACGLLIAHSRGALHHRSMPQVLKTTGSKVTLIFGLLAFAWATQAATPTDNAAWRRLFDSWKAPCDPVRIAGPVYYVGASGVSAFLITSPEGHILIDTGFEETVGVIRTNVARLGFKMAEIKYLLASHAHLDHVGGHALMKELTGAKIVMSEADAALLASGGKDDFGPTADPQMAYRPGRADRVVRDGDTVSVGDVTLRCHLTPGHTRGATTWSMTVMEGGERLNVVFFSSLSLLDGTKVQNNPKYPNLVADYRATFEKLRSLPCDIFLAPHAGMFSLAEKASRQKRGEKPNPFIDRESLLTAVANAEKALNAALQK
jgi:metallo-beta-lactamase class B